VANARVHCLGLILACFLVYLARLQPWGYYGIFGDDALYFSSGRALAEGQGYVMPSLPGAPPQTKYPPLYPWILSWVWKWNPSFPRNVESAVWVTAAFGCWALAASYALLRSFVGLGRWRALAVTALVAFNPHFLFFSGAVMSNVPFMAMLLTAAAAGDAGLRRDGRWPLAAAAGLLAGLATMTRSLGLAAVLGLAACGAYRRAWRQTAVALLGTGPAIAAALLWPGRKALVESVASSAAPGWRQTWLYYTSYTDFWKLSVPDLSTLLAMVQVNLLEFIKAPVALCLFPPQGESGFFGLLLTAVLFAGIVGGIVGHVRRHEIKPIHFILTFYTPVILLWNFSLMDIFLQPFLPLFYAGAWFETQRFIGMLAQALRGTRPAPEKALAGVMALGMAAIGVLAVEHYARGLRPGLRALAQKRNVLRQEQAQAYQWIRGNTNPETRLIAYEHVNLYLATGRQAMPPLVFTTDLAYVRNPQRLKQQLDSFTDVARHIGARYWVIAASENPTWRERTDALRAALPRVFRSAQGTIEIYDLSGGAVGRPAVPQASSSRTTLP
jgi:4-amino-4-deoxy-L-arabinose transferase-like glycosyltransferase